MGSAGNINLLSFLIITSLKFNLYIYIFHSDITTGIRDTSRSLATTLSPKHPIKIHWNLFERTHECINLSCRDKNTVTILAYSNDLSFDSAKCLITCLTWTSTDAHPLGLGYTTEKLFPLFLSPPVLQSQTPCAPMLVILLNSAAAFFTNWMNHPRGGFSLFWNEVVRRAELTLRWQPFHRHLDSNQNPPSSPGCPP